LQRSTTHFHPSCSVDIDATFEAKGVKSAKDRLTLASTDDVRTPFPAAVKAAKVDTITMKHFLSGFTDDDAKLVLKHCGEVLEPNGKVLLLQVRSAAHPVTDSALQH
jgi:predicted SAM-dependent methyltransferase